MTAEMDPGPLGGSMAELQAFLLALLAAELPAHLTWLKFARIGDVASLIRRQARYHQLSETALARELAPLPHDLPFLREWARRKVLSVCESARQLDYVQDCERIARHNDPAASAEARTEIRRTYWQEYYALADRMLWTVLFERLGRRKAEVHFAQAQDMVQEGVFLPASFDSCARSYQPAEGKRFDTFFRQLILWRCLSAARHFRKAREPVREQVTPPPPVPEAMGPMQQLRLCLDCLATHQSPRNRHLGRQECAVYELWHKAYLAPPEMTPFALEMAGQGALQRLLQEYEESQRALKTLVDATLPTAESVMEEARAAMEALRDELARQDLSPSRLDELRAEGIGREIEPMRSERKGIDPSGRPLLHGPREIDYMIACRRYENARRALENARTGWATYQQFRLPWVRSQPDVAVLIGRSQAFVSRRLASAKKFLAVHGHRFLDSEGTS